MCVCVCVCVLAAGVLCLWVCGRGGGVQYTGMEVRKEYQFKQSVLGKNKTKSCCLISAVIVTLKFAINKKNNYSEHRSADGTAASKRTGPHAGLMCLKAINQAQRINRAC